MIAPYSKGERTLYKSCQRYDEYIVISVILLKHSIVELKINEIPTVKEIHFKQVKI